MPDPVPHEGGGRHHDVGAREQVGRHVLRALDAGRRTERGPDPVVQDRDPGAGQPGLRRGGQVEAGRHREGLGVDVGLEVAVEQHQPVGAGAVQADRHLAGGAEVRTQLHHHRHRDDLADLLQDGDVEVLDGTARRRRVARHDVHVELDGGGPGVDEGAREADPPARGAAVEAGDDRDVHGGRALLDEPQVAGGTAGLGGRGGREVRRGLTVGVLGPLGHGEVVQVLAGDLLLEQRGQDDRPDARVGERSDAVDALGGRGRARDEGVAQPQPEVGGAQVRHGILRPSVAKRSAPRVAISS